MMKAFELLNYPLVDWDVLLLQSFVVWVFIALEAMVVPEQLAPDLLLKLDALLLVVDGFELDGLPVDVAVHALHVSLGLDREDQNDVLQHIQLFRVGDFDEH